MAIPKQPDNPPAFPRTFSVEDQGDYHEKKWAQEGMELRDYFAAKAMASFIHPTDSLCAEDAAKAAYQYADAMLAERSK